MNIPEVKIFNYTWDYSFSNARNYSISKATGDYIFIIDADEYIKKFNITELYNQKFEEFQVYSPSITNIISENFKKTSTKTITRRIFRNGDFYFYGLVHEEPRIRKQYFNKNSKIKDVLLAESSIHHDGYDYDVVNEKQKVRRNLILLKMQIKLEPQNSRWSFHYMVQVYNYVTGKQKAKKFMKSIIDNINVLEDKNNLEQFRYYESCVALYVKFLISIDELKIAKDICDRYVSSTNIDFLNYRIEIKRKELIKQVFECAEKASNKSAYSLTDFEGDILYANLAEVLLFSTRDINYVNNLFEIDILQTH